MRKKTGSLWKRSKAASIRWSSRSRAPEIASDLGLDAGADRVRARLDHGLEQLLLALEQRVERAERDLGAGGERAHLRAVEAVFGELGGGGRDHVGAPQRQLAFAPLLPAGAGRIGGFSR